MLHQLKRAEVNQGNESATDITPVQYTDAETSFGSLTKCNKSAKFNNLAFKVTFLARPSSFEGDKICQKCNKTKCNNLLSVLLISRCG